MGPGNGIDASLTAPRNNAHCKAFFAPVLSAPNAWMATAQRRREAEQASFGLRCQCRTRNIKLCRGRHLEIRFWSMSRGQDLLGCLAKQQIPKPSNEARDAEQPLNWPYRAVSPRSLARH